MYNHAITGSVLDLGPVIEAPEDTSRRPSQDTTDVETAQEKKSSGFNFQLMKDPRLQVIGTCG